MITKNEEKNIEKCIKSYKNIVNEIIVVDTGSTDKTIEIAKRFGAKVYSYQWNNDFSAAKNYAIDMANGEWIIFLDADEYFEKNKEMNLLNIIRNANNRTDLDGIMIKLYNIDKSGSDIIDSMVVVRIFRNHENIRFFGNIHEAIMNDGKDIKCEFVEEEYIKVFHTGYSTNIIDSKVERNLKILKDNFSKGNVRPLDYIYMCDCYMSLHKYDMVINYAREYLKLNDYVIGYNSKPYQLLITALDQNGCTTDELKNEINEAIKKFPKHPEFYRYLAAVYSTEKKYQLALETYLKTLKLQDEYNDIEVNNVPSTLFDIYYNIGILYEYKNDNLKAFDFYYKSLKANIYNESVFIRLIRILKDEKVEDIVALLNTIYNNCEEDIRFIITVLMKIKHGELLLHFYNIWNKVYNNEDISLMFVLISNHYYEKSFDMFYDAFLIEKSEEYKVLAIVSAILSNNEELIQKVVNVVDDVYINIINSYLGKERVLLNQDNLRKYTKLLQEIVLVSNDKDVVNRYLSSILEFESAQIAFPIVKILKDNNLYDCAINILSNVLEYGNKSVSKIYYEMGYCYYKLMNYIKSIQCFKEALNYGYSVDKIECYLNWILDRTGSNKIHDANAFEPWVKLV